ncbi:MAG: hypothetical protein LUC47_09395, partial [Clostridiales bacterium]|nr:hypothetical protein [Clostridiales bacterium]
LHYFCGLFFSAPTLDIEPIKLNGKRAVSGLDTALFAVCCTVSLVTESSKSLSLFVLAPGQAGVYTPWKSKGRRSEHSPISPPLTIPFCGSFLVKSGLL